MQGCKRLDQEKTLGTAKAGGATEVKDFGKIGSRAKNKIIKYPFFMFLGLIIYF